MAAYAQALDDGRTEDIVATFCSDGVVEIPGWAPTKGTRRSGRPSPASSRVRPQRHVVVNTLVTDWNEAEAAAVSDLLFLPKGRVGLGRPVGGPVQRHVRAHGRCLAFSTAVDGIRELVRADLGAVAPPALSFPT